VQCDDEAEHEAVQTWNVPHESPWPDGIRLIPPPGAEVSRDVTQISESLYHQRPAARVRVRHRFQRALQACTTIEGL
jgi:hypothetical protein